MRRALRSACLAAVVAAAGLLPAAVARAAEPVFVAGSSAGLVPPPAMTPATGFAGFRTPSGSSIVITDMPPEAQAELSGGFTAERLKAQGLVDARREDVQVDGRKAILVTARQTVSGVTVGKAILVAASPDATVMIVANRLPTDASVTDADMRRALLSTVLRKPASLEEQVAALPFRVDDRAGFRVVRAFGGSSLALTEGPKDVDPEGEQPFVIVAAALGSAAVPPDLDAFARRALSGVSQLAGATVEATRTYERDGHAWHELVATAKGARAGESLVVLQAFRFTGQADRGYLRVIAMGPATARDALLARFRRVAESVAPRP